MSVIKKEKITIVIGEYTDNQGQLKKKYRTIGELVTMQGDNGPYQFGEIWGPHGSTNFKVYEEDTASNSYQQAQAPQQDYQQQAPQNYQQQPRRR